MEKTSSFKPSIKVSCGQIVAIVFILCSVISIPFLVGYLKNPNRKSPGDIINGIVDGVKNFSFPESVTLPLLHTQIDFSVFRERPELLIYIGIGLIIAAFIIMLSLARSLLRSN